MTSPLTEQQLDDIETRAGAATPGPWGVYEYGGDSLIEIAADLEDTGCGYRARRTVCRFDEEPLDNDPAHREWTAEEDWAQVQADAAFVAHAPEDVRALLAEIRRLRAAPTPVPSAPADRAAVLREAADAITEVIEADRTYSPRRSNDRAALGGAREIVLNLIDKPSRMADEAQQPARPGFTVEDFARMAAGADVIAGRAQLPFDQLPAEEQERHRHAARTLLNRADETQQPEACGPAPDQCDAEAGEPCANHEREQAHAEGEHCFCGPECDKACTCAVAGDAFVPLGHYADCPQSTQPAVGAQQPKEAVRLAAYQTCGVCSSGYPTGGTCGTCEFNARMATEARQADTAGEQQ